MDQELVYSRRIETAIRRLGRRLGLWRALHALARNFIGTITHVSTQSPVVALTFDGGPDPRWTPRLLDILDKHQAQATFFMIGKLAHDHPDIIRKVAQAGHVIGNHSWDHPSFPLISRRERRRQIFLCANAIAPYGRRLFRPPYGHQNITSYIEVMLLGYKVVAWSLHAYDWRDDQDPKWMAQHLESNVKPGDIILLHDTVCVIRRISREPMLAGLDMFLNRVGNRFRFITAPELFQHGRVRKKTWYMKPDLDYLSNINVDFGYDAERRV